jgi:hypothetical protein
MHNGIASQDNFHLGEDETGSCKTDCHVKAQFQITPMIPSLLCIHEHLKWIQDTFLLISVYRQAPSSLWLQLNHGADELG